MPVTWKDIEGGLMPDAFSLGTDALLKRLAGEDPWKDFFAAARSLNRG